MRARPVCCNLKARLFNKLGLNLFTLPVLKKAEEAEGTFTNGKKEKSVKPQGRKDFNKIPSQKSVDWCENAVLHFHCKGFE